MSDSDNLERFQIIIERYNINDFFAIELNKLEHFEICIICDDSSSMLNLVKNPIFNSGKTRWNEVQTSLKIVTDLASIFDNNAIDIYYLNRPAIKNLYRSEDISNYKSFFDEPEGFTPLAERFQEVLNSKKNFERNLLIIIFTDGQPNNLKLFMDVLKNRESNYKIFISIVSCTDDPECVRYFNDLNKEIKHVLVYDDYNTKKKRIEKVQGKKFNYTFGDYIAEILISSINKNMDKIDAVKSNIKQLDTINKKNEFCFIC
jgi:hypothetical protein